MRTLSLLLNTALFVGLLVVATPTAHAQTAVRDSVRMDIRVFNNTGRTEAGNGFCEVGIVAIWPNVLQDLFGSADRLYGYNDYSLVATEGFYVRPGLGAVPQLPPGSAFLGHNPELAGSAFNFNTDGPIPDCASTREWVEPVAAGGWTLDGGRPYRITEWYAVYELPDGTPVALFEWEQTEGLAVAFDGFEPDLSLSREVDASAPGGKRPVVAYAWDFGDGQTGSGAEPTHTYAEEGTYAVTLTVTDDDGQENARTDTVRVAAARLAYTVEADLDEATVGDEVAVAMTVTNVGSEPVFDVEVPRQFTPTPRVPEEAIIEDHYVRSAGLSPVDLAPGEEESERRSVLAPGESVEVERTYVVERAFRWEFLNGDLPISFEAPVEWEPIAVIGFDDAGERVPEVDGCAEVGSCPDTTLITVPQVPELFVSVSADPDTIGVGGEFDVLVVVVNEGEGDAEDVRPTGPLTITSDNGGAATVLSGPTPASLATLAGGIRDTLVYRARADALGTLAFVVPIVGTDEAGEEVQAESVCLVGDGGERTGDAGARRATERCEAEVTEIIVVTTTGDEENPPESIQANLCDVELEAEGLQCTLRAAVMLANERGTASTIHFDIEAEGLPRIQVTEYTPVDNPEPFDVQQVGLPEFNVPIELDGTTQPGGWVELVGLGTRNLDTAPWADGIRIGAGGAGSVVRGLVIHSFEGALVRTRPGADDCRIEGNRLGTDVTGTQARGTPGVMRFTSDLEYAWESNQGAAFTNLHLGSSGNQVTGNVIGGNVHCPNPSIRTHAGVDILMERNTEGNILTSNFVGVSESGAVIDVYSNGRCAPFGDAPDDLWWYGGALIYGTGHRIGGGEGNTFAGHRTEMFVRESERSEIVGNQFGLETLPEDYRVNTLFGLIVDGRADSAVEQRGRMAENDFWSEAEALIAENWDVVDNRIVGNQDGREEPSDIGDVSIVQNFGVQLNGGVHFERNEVDAKGWAIGVFGTDNRIVDTQIGEGFGGIYVREEATVLISRTTSLSTYKAIHLGDGEIFNGTSGFPPVTLNDVLELDEGGNGLLNYPQFTSVTRSGSTFRVEGYLEGAFSGTYTIEAFANGACTDASHFGWKFGGGQTYLGSITVTPTAGDLGGPTFVYEGEGLDPATPEVYITFTASRAEEQVTSEFSRCLLPAEEDEVARAEVAPGQTGEVLAGVEAVVAIETAAAARGAAHPGGTVYATRYDATPDTSVFAAGSSLAPDGTMVTPEAVAPRTWFLAETGLTVVPEGDTSARFTVCLAPTDAVLTPASVVLVLRSEQTEGWVPLDTRTETRDGAAYLCASGLDALGEFGFGGAADAFPVASEDDDPAAGIPALFALAAYPNPTAGRATVEVALPEAADVRAEVFDLLGRRVAMLHDGLLAAGTHPLALDAAQLPAGVYVVRALTPDAFLTQRVTVVR